MRRKAETAVLPRRRIIASLDDLTEGSAALARSCRHMRRAYMLTGDPPLRRERGGFEGLARIIVGQQVSTASANAIWARFEARVVPMEAQTVAGLEDADLKGAGLSMPKIRTFRAVVDAIGSGNLDFTALDELEDGEVRDRLIAIKGIGPWSADIYLMFCIGRTDAFAPGDLALQIACQRLMALDARPSPVEIERIAERWRPWRGVAARILWAYYRVSGNAASGAPM